MENIESNDSKERMDKRLERMHKIESSWDHEIINQDKCQTCKFHLDAFPNGTPCWKCLEGSPLTVSGKYYKEWISSNADHIRSMSDEELAWELCRIQRMPFYKDDNDIDEYEVDCWAKWLKEEYKE